jgi:hypothetical protein
MEYAAGHFLYLFSRLTCGLLTSAYRALCPHPEAAWPLKVGDTVRVLVGPKSGNWALGRVAAVCADGTVDVNFEEGCCPAGYGEIEMTETPGDDYCCASSRPRRVMGTVGGVALDKLLTAGRSAIQGAPEMLPVSQSKPETFPAVN